MQEALARSMAGRTTIVVAHRLSTIRSATTIAVVQARTLSPQSTNAAPATSPRGQLQMYEGQQLGCFGHEATNSAPN